MIKDFNKNRYTCIFLKNKLLPAVLTLTVIINQSVPCHITFGKDAKLETKVIFVILIFTTHLKSDCLWKLQTKLLILDSEFTTSVGPKVTWPPARTASICPQRLSTTRLTVTYLTCNNRLEFSTAHPLFYRGEQLPHLPIPAPRGGHWCSENYGCLNPVLADSLLRLHCRTEIMLIEPGRQCEKSNSSPVTSKFGMKKSQRTEHVYTSGAILSTR